MGDPEKQPAWQPPTLLQQLSFVSVGVFVFCSTPLWSLPYALRGGWNGLYIFLFFFLMSFFTAIFIPFCIHHRFHLRAYPDMGYAAYGERGRLAVSIIVCIFSYATCIDCVMLLKENLNVYFPLTAFPFTMNLLVYPTFAAATWIVDEYNPWLPGVGNLLTVIVVLCLAFVGIFYTGFDGDGRVFFDGSILHHSIGFYALCFCGHSYMPMMYSVVKNRVLYWKLLSIIFVISALLYAATGTIGYLMFGVQAKTIFTLNLPTHLTATKIAICSTVIIQVIRYIHNISALAVILNDFLLVRQRNFQNRAEILLVLKISTLIALVDTSYYGPLVSLSGSIVGVLISVIVPSLCFYGSNWSDLRIFQGAFWIIPIIVGVIAVVCTSYRSIQGLSNDSSN